MNCRHLYFVCVSRSEAIRHQINETIDESARKYSSNWFSTTDTQRENKRNSICFILPLFILFACFSGVFHHQINLPLFCQCRRILTNAFVCVSTAYWPLHSYVLFTVCVYFSKILELSGVRLFPVN